MRSLLFFIVVLVLIFINTASQSIDHSEPNRQKTKIPSQSISEEESWSQRRRFIGQVSEWLDKNVIKPAAQFANNAKNYIWRNISNPNSTLIPASSNFNLNNLKAPNFSGFNIFGLGHDFKSPLIMPSARAIFYSAQANGLNESGQLLAPREALEKKLAEQQGQVALDLCNLACFVRFDAELNHIDLLLSKRHGCKSKGFSHNKTDLFDECCNAHNKCLDSKECCTRNSCQLLKNECDKMYLQCMSMFNL